MLRPKIEKYRVRCYVNEPKQYFGDYTVSGRPGDLFTYTSYFLKSKRAPGSTTADHLGALEYCFALMARRQQIVELLINYQ